MKSLNLTLLVDAEHHGVDRRLQVKTHDVANFFAELGIRRERETLAAMDCRPKACQMRLMLDWLIPSCWASPRVLQWVAFLGMLSRVLVITSSTR